ILSADELARIGRAAEAADAWVVSDEVYEQLVLTDQAHVPPAVALEDTSRVVTVSSAGKSWNTTGWKIGCVVASAEVREAVQAARCRSGWPRCSPADPVSSRRTALPWPPAPRCSYRPAAPCRERSYRLRGPGTSPSWTSPH